MCFLGIKISGRGTTCDTHDKHVREQSGVTSTVLHKQSSHTLSECRNMDAELTAQGKASCNVNQEKFFLLNKSNMKTVDLPSARYENIFGE